MPVGAISGVTYTFAPRAQFFLFGDSITQYGGKVGAFCYVSQYAFKNGFSCPVLH